MADLRIGRAPTVAPAVTRPVPAARAEAIRSAQRAFFEAALAGEMQAASAPTAAAPVQPVAAPARASFDADAPAPRAPLRPGSLLDIRV